MKVLLFTAAVLLAACAGLDCWDKKKDPKGALYRGTLSRTQGGYTCQAWSARGPNWNRYYTSSRYPKGGLDKNYCRNPTGKAQQPWCYNASGTNPRWQYCAVPDCSVLGANEAKVENNVDYWGSDIKMVHSTSLRNCYNQCQGQKGCVAFTRITGNGNCWLKKQYNGLHRTVGKVGLQSANMVLLTSRPNGLSSCEANVEYNVDYWGADIKRVKSTGLRDCYNQCRAQKGCVSFTMRKNDKTCWLKRRKTGANRKVNQPTLISASLTPQSSSTLGSCEARVEYNVDYWGADIKSMKTSGLRDCYNKCRAQVGCVSFTMRKSDHYCWLKKLTYGQHYTKNRHTLISANLVY